MAEQNPVRSYVVVNATALFGADRLITFTSAAPAGATVAFRVDGRRVRATLTGEQLANGRFRADLEVPYL
ncbi:hypothetical protein [Streptomyces anthocyanicus]|uniref:hypothetical protein n=1 Tax=Streptomyces anthocyanicus TaxID=68174 RepID=UPI0038232D0E